MSRTPLLNHPALPSDAEFERMKRSLLVKIDEAETDSAERPDSGPRRGRRRLISGLSIAAAVGLTTTLVLTDLVGLAGWRGGASPAAAAVLSRAAEHMGFVDAELDAGEYLLVDSESVNLNSSQASDGSTINFYAREFSQLYVPADRSDEWVWVRPRGELVEVLTPGGESVIQQDYDALREEWGDEPERLRASGGAFYGVPSDTQWGNVADLPRDPYRLLNHIYLATLGKGSSPDGEALVFIADTLRQGTAPADVREALLRAAILIPGVTVTDERANLDGVTGVAIGRLEDTSGLRQELIFDADTGVLIGERQIVVSSTDPDLVPGDIFQWSSIRTSVVGSAPAGGTPNGALDVMGCVPTGSGAFQCPVPGQP